MDGPAQITATAAHFDALIGETVSTSASLPSTGNFKGRTIIAEDTGIAYWHNGSGWKKVGRDTGWAAVPLSSNWASYNASQWGTFSYRLQGNRVFLRGIVQASAGAGTTIGTLPTGFRPPYSVELPVDRSGAYSGVTVNTDGTMVTNVAPGAGSTYAFGDLSFSID
jgi:hypothetical protein